MKIQITRSEDESTTIVEPSDTLSFKLRRGFSSLVEGILCDTQEVQVTVEATLTPEGYEYDIDHGNAGLSMEQIAQIQQTAKMFADEYISADASRRGAKVTTTLYDRTFDPLGLRRRLWRLTN